MKKSELKISIVAMTPNPLEMVYRGYRVCYSKYTYDTLPIPSEEEMKSFIKRNMLKGHTTPLEHVSFTFSIEGISRAAQQQLTRHRTGKYNVQSQRYVDGDNFGYVVPQLITELGLEDAFELHMEQVTKAYNYLRDNIKSSLDQAYGPQKEHINMAKETARAVLPMATDSKMLITFDLHNLRNFLRQRKCRHAQDEIRVIAREMERQVKEHFSLVGIGISNCGTGCDCKEALKTKKIKQPTLIFDKSLFIEHQLSIGVALSPTLSLTWPDDCHGKKVYYDNERKGYFIEDDNYIQVLKEWIREV